jgi:hypothetical protein
VSKLPDVADSIFCRAVISTGSLRAMAPSWPNLSWLRPSGAITGVSSLLFPFPFPLGRDLPTHNRSHGPSGYPSPRTEGAECGEAGRDLVVRGSRPGRLKCTSSR